MRRNKRFYRCKNEKCLFEFSELNSDKKCDNCGSDKIEIVRIVQSDNAGEIEIKKDI